MIRYRTETVERHVIDEVICSCCGESMDDMECQEALHWQMTGGYTSVFGDGVEISLNLCQKCIQERLGDCIEINQGYQ